MKKPTIIIYLTGKPGIGKYTIAKELASRYGFIVCDNQLINNPIFELLQYDRYSKIPDFAWEAIGNIGRCISTFLIKEIHNSYVLTNNLYEDTGDKVCYAEEVYIAEARGSIFVPVRLLIDQDEHLRRVVNPNRRDRWKSIDPQDVHDETPLLWISHPNLFSLNVSNLNPEDVAKAIVNHIQTINPEVNIKTLKHTTAKSYYYNTRPERWYEFNKNNSRAIKWLLEKILKEHHVANVLDLICWVM